ncbi:alpha/beta hydrolase [Prosthecomicrobium sp. N25]|uniref:alpha/beta hydrolase n=1 Tax=Prosthecomicrobium sp. N25 TaxID=3129254 RepID=UPI0030789A87
MAVGKCAADGSGAAVGEGMALYRQFTTQEEIDLEYRPELTAADPLAFERIVAWRRERSEAARRDLTLVAGLRYGPTRTETLDLYPASEPNAPILLFLHGGYWSNRALFKELYGWVAAGFVPAGVTTAVIDYGCCPDVTIDEITRQCRAAVAWLHANGSGFGADPGRIYVAGNSAGGHLAAMLAVTDWVGLYGLPKRTVAGACPISGLFDLEPFPYSWLQPKLQLTAAEVRRNSPILRVPEDGPSLLVTWGALESCEFHRQSTDFVAAWRSAGNTAETLVQPGRDHFDANVGLGEPESMLFHRVREHMRACFAGC